MAGNGDDGSPPPQDLLDSSPSEIKLFLGTQVPGGQEVTVSRAALEDMSPVFKNMLTHNMVERIQGQVRLEHISMETWNVISAFYFSGEDLVCMDNVEEIVSVADMYEMTKLKDHCDVYLCKNAVCGDDLVGVLNWASTFTLAKLKKKNLKVVRDDFMALCQSESFLRLNRDVLLDILGCPYIFGDEHSVCLAVMRWLDAQNANCQTVEQLFQHLKLNEVCLCCLEKQVADFDSAAVRDVVRRLVEAEKQEREKTLPGRLPLQYFVDNTEGYRCLFPKKPGKPFGQRCMCPCPMEPELIFIGRDEDDSCKVGVINGNGDWTALSSIPAKWKLAPTSACVFDNCLVLTGRRKLCCTYFYDLTSQSWKIGPLLQEKRESHALVSMGNAMYAVMGQGNDGLLSSIETFSLEGTQWSFVGRMQKASRSVSAATTGSLILAHGVTEDKHSFLQSFNTESKVATIIGRTPKVMHFYNVISFGSKGALFLQMNRAKLVCPNSDGEFSISNWQLPNLKNVFEVEKESFTDNQMAHSEQLCSELKKLTMQKSQVPYFVQHDLTGGRANLTPFPALAGKDVTFLLRP